MQRRLSDKSLRARRNRTFLSETSGIDLDNCKPLARKSRVITAVAEDVSDRAAAKLHNRIGPTAVRNDCCCNSDMLSINKILDMKITMLSTEL